MMSQKRFRLEWVSVLMALTAFVGCQGADAPAEPSVEEEAVPTKTIAQALGDCNEVNPPRYRGASVTMNTHSYGGGYSLAYDEFVYPQWAGRTVHRYSTSYEYLGSFTVGRDYVMQIAGDEDGNFYTAHWSRNFVAKWQGRSENEVWETDLGEVVGGVAFDDEFVYAASHVEPKLWKLNQETGEVIEEKTLPTTSGTLYGGLAVQNGVLYMARSNGIVYRVNLDTMALIDQFEVGASVRNTAFTGRELCISPNTDDVFCYEVCNNPLEPRAKSQQVSSFVNEEVNITLQGEDDNNRELSFEIIDLPQHGSLSGEAPNLTYQPIVEFVGFDRFTFRVNNDINDSTVVSVDITVLPEREEQGQCDRLETPRYRGGLVSMNTRSHGGGYSPAYNEFWYPQWSGTTIHRYNQNNEFIGTFNSGQNLIMQLWGDKDGSYYTAHWSNNQVSKWQALSANLTWSTDLGTTIGGVTSNDEFVFAMAHSAATLWKLDKNTGEVIEQFSLPSQGGTLYGGLALIDGVLYVARSTGIVYMYDASTLEAQGQFIVDTTVYNMSFDGNDMCVSPNSDIMYCYTICDNADRPRALGQQLSVQRNSSLDLTLEGTDPNDLPLTFIVTDQPEHGSLSGTLPNLTYTPITEFTGFDSFSFKVSNGDRESPTVNISITVIPPVDPPGECQRVEPPEFRGGLVEMPTRSYGGGFSPAFNEWWYPQWSGRTIYRYDRDRNFIGTFNSGRNLIMQLVGLRDGSYVTAHWTARKVARWQALGSNLIWSTDLGATIGGVAEDGEFVYAMDYRAPRVWKLDINTGAIIEEFAVPAMTGTLYGGLVLADGVLYAARDNGLLVSIDLETRQELGRSTIDTNVRNMAFDGNDMCVSPNSNILYCYTVCDDETRPSALSQQVNTRLNESVSLTLEGSDPLNRDLSFTVVSLPQSGSLRGNAPNLTYEPIEDYTGFDSFTFKVNNGVKDSATVRVNITVLPDVDLTGDCSLVSTPQYRGGTVEMATRSYGGGFSPAFGEYWYPQWSGRNVYRYNREHEFVGVFTTGLDQNMQLWGLDDGTYLTANWSRKKVARWQGLSSNLIWSVDLPDVVGGVTSDDEFVYAMAHVAPTLWKINKETGVLVETITLPEMGGTLYGGLVFVKDVLHVVRTPGKVFRIDLDTNEIVDSFDVDTDPRNSSFDGNELCLSPNSNNLFCYTLCEDSERPVATGQQAVTEVNVAVSITLTGQDPNNRELTFSVLEPPRHGALTGTAPDLTYTPILDYTGFDSFTFKVSNGTRDSPVYTAYITVLPEVAPPSQCDLINPPEFLKGTVEMPTRSYGGGYSPAFGEWWYPSWSGRTIYRYGRDRQLIGTFTTGRDYVMQLWGERDGTYLTANWSRNKVARWQGLSDNLIWSASMNDVVGGVTSDDEFVYAMAHQAETVWRLNKTTGALLEEFTLSDMPGTLYGGLALVDNHLYVGRDNGTVYRFSLQSRELVDSFPVATTIRNMAFDGTDMCVSPNSDSLYCYNVCNDSERPQAVSQQLSTNANTSLDITLAGEDQNNRALTMSVVTTPSHGSLSGEAPNLRYTPLTNFEGVDSFTFRVNNGLKDSAAVQVSIAVLPGEGTDVDCELVNPPVYRGAPVVLNTRSYGGGYSTAYDEHWYPHWSGTTVYRYNRNLEFVGTFQSGRDQMMQLWGLDDGSYLTANWDRRKVSRWQALSADVFWTASLPDVVGGVTSDGQDVYAMAHQAKTIWRLDMETGRLLETFEAPIPSGGTLYGSLAIVDGILYIGRNSGTVYRVELSTRTLLDSFETDSGISNMSFDGEDYCVSPNTDQVFCYNLCNDARRPVAATASLTTTIDTALDITLSGSDQGDRPLTFEIVKGPNSGALSGTAPDVVYTPQSGFVGLDRFTFKVNNGIKDSYIAQVSVLVQPDNDIDLSCDSLDTPLFRGAPVDMNTRSHGGGFSKTFNEYWYPQWSGTAIFRYDRDLQPVGIFNTGRGRVMQLWGDTDGHYYTAHWTYNNVSKWQDLSSNVVWTTEMPDTVGGVTADEDFVYVMASTGNTVWRLNKETGEIINSFVAPVGDGTLYGGLSVAGGILHVARAGRPVYRVRLSNNTLIDQFSIGTTAYNMSFDGTDMCFSANRPQVYCYSVCDEGDRPRAGTQQVNTTVNSEVSFTLLGEDPQDLELSFILITAPEHGALSGDAPNLTYTPIADYTGFDSFTFKVSNGTQTSAPVTVNVAVLPEQPPVTECQTLPVPEYRGAPVEMNTRSYGGGYNPAFGEYWYPVWSGTTIYRYSREREFIGTFRTGRSRVMQLWGDADGSYYTANYTDKVVAKWQGLSANLFWSTEVDENVGGVTADDEFVYAMALTGPRVWKLNKETGQLLETFSLPVNSGTLYGGLALIDGLLYVGRSNGSVYRFDLETRQLVDQFSAETVIRNMAYDGNDYCISPNSDQVYCYTTCRDNTQPVALTQFVSTEVNTAVDITLTGSDPLRRALTYEVVNRPQHGSLTGTAPNLSYDPIDGFTGIDSLSFKVNNGLQDSLVVRVSITVLEGGQTQTECDPEETPVYRGSPVTMNTRSHGGGFSPPFGEFWYPAWSGTTIYRYNRDNQEVGTFRTGRSAIMQLWGLDDGSYLTAHWSQGTVTRWLPLSDDAIWTTELGGVVGGVTADDRFVYAMDYRRPLIYRLDLEDGELLETLDAPTLPGTLYGGLTIIDGILHVGRDDGNVYKIDLNSMEQVGVFTVATSVYNSSFDGQDYCISPNSDALYCYRLCRDPNQPSASGSNVTTSANTTVNITLSGTDPQDRDLTYEILDRPDRGSLRGTAPNLSYEPIFNFTGFDSFTFKVNNGVRDSPVVRVNISVLPVLEPPANCEPLDTPRYRGAPAEMNTRSHGGGYSPAYQEYWYPQWSGTTIHRYDLEHRFVGTFRTGRRLVMQLWGLDDGSYLTAHWSAHKVARWQGLSADNIWTTDVEGTIGGVTADEQFAYAITSDGKTLYKLDLQDGRLLETLDIVDGGGTIYGGFALVGDEFFLGRNSGSVLRINKETLEVDGRFEVSSNIYNMSFNGQEYCVSPNTSSLYCFALCEEDDVPRAIGQQVSTQVNTEVEVILSGEDLENRELTFTLLSRPEHGSLVGDAPNYTYQPINDYIGTDRMSFKVNNGVKDSAPVTINISVLPPSVAPEVCNALETPRYRGAPAVMDTRSHGGGYSPAFNEYWTPAWSGNTVYRYNRDREFVGTFRSGRGQMMQLAGDLDGSYYTANWGYRIVAKWDALSADNIWSTPFDTTVGGVAVDENFVYAMHNSGGIVYRLNKTTGAIVSQFEVSGMSGTLYGGLAVVNGVLMIGRDSGVVYRVNLETEELIDTFAVASNIYNMSFDGQDYCISPNSDQVYCYAICEDPEQPKGDSQEVATVVNQAVDFTLTGSDPSNRPLTFEIINRPEHGSLTGTSPNFNYASITDYVGVDSFTFKVNNGIKDSTPVTVNLSIIPDFEPRDPCVLADEPTYRGRPAEMNTRSHGGGYSPVFLEYWYPNWSGRTITRYNENREFVGTFTTGRSSVMQLWGETDGSYYTANWSSRIVAKWQGLSANLIWSTDLGVTAGGVTADDNFVYAMSSSGSRVWKLSKSDGTVVEEFDIEATSGTLYGGLAVLDGDLIVGRDNGTVYRIDLDTRQIVSQFTTAARVQNMAFNGVDYCISQNNSDVHCYAMCSNNLNRPPFIAEVRDRSNEEGDNVALSLTAFDEDNDVLSFSATGLPQGLQIDEVTGTITGIVADGAQDDSPYNVTLRASDGLDIFETTFEWVAFDPNIDPPIITERLPADGWVNGPFRVRARVQDECSGQPITFIQGRNLTTDTEEYSEGGWQVTTGEVSGETIHNFGVRARSVCSNKGATDNIFIGIDTVAPSLNFTSGEGVLGQDEVDIDDPSTWPSLSGDAVVPMLALLQDSASGLASATATIVPIREADDDSLELEEDRAVVVHDATLPAQGQSPPTGARTLVHAFCSNNTYCQGPNLLLGALTLGLYYELRLSITDFAGNTVSQRYRFQSVDLSRAISQWRDAVLAIDSDVPQVDDFLSQAVAKLGLALLGYEQEQYGNMFLALEDAGGLIAQAQLFDNFSTKPQAQVVATLAAALLERELREAVDGLGRGVFFDTTSEFITRARSNIALEEEGSARTAFLELANGFFWLEEGRDGLVADGFETAKATMDTIVARMSSYIDHNPELPGRDDIITARTALSTVVPYLTTISEQGPFAADDLEHVEALLVITDAAESIKEAEESTAWIRQYQWGLTQIVYILTERGLSSATSLLGVNHPIILDGGNALAEASGYRDDFRADDFMNLLINSRCLIVGIYNRAFEPDVTPPLSCCDQLIGFNNDDPLFPVPDTCQ